MYVVVIAFLALLLTLPPDKPVYGLISGLAPTSAALALVTALPALIAVVGGRRTLRLLELYPERPSGAQAAFGRTSWLAQTALGFGQIAALLTTDWLPLCHRVPVVGDWPVVPSLIALGPFLLAVLLLWLMLYPADRAIRQIALEVYLVRGRPLRPLWHLRQYLLYNLRHQVLFVLIPMLLILVASDLIIARAAWIERRVGLPYAPDLLVGAAALLVAIFAPEILRRVWITQRLPSGPLRDRLGRLAAKLRLRCRDILVWRSGGMVVNAAVMGVIPPVRYVLITDAMLEQMEETKIEAVFGHEAGHVKRHHIFFFLLFGLISGCLATIASIRLQTVRGSAAQVAGLLVGAVFAIKWLVVFGWISRRFERQADVSGVRTLMLGGLPCGQPCAVHGRVASPARAAPVSIQTDPPSSGADLTPAPTLNAPDAPDRAAPLPARRLDPAPADAAESPSEDALCATAAHVFGDALHEVALLNGIRPEQRSWRHSSIASRARFLAALAHAPERVAQFETLVWWVKVAIFFGAVVAAAWALLEMSRIRLGG